MFGGTCALRKRGGELVIRSIDLRIRLTTYWRLARDGPEDTAAPSSLAKQQTVDYNSTTNEVACNRIYPSLCENADVRAVHTL